LFEKWANAGNNSSSCTLSKTFLLQQVAYTIDKICAKEKTVKVTLAKNWQKSVNITYQVYLKPTIY